MRNGTLRAALVDITVDVMRDKKKKGYYATSVKRFHSISGKGTPEERFRATGSIYINYKDIDDLDMLLKAVAHESGHLLDDKEGAWQDILEYLKKEFKEA